MQSVVQGFVSQTLKMDPIEKARRWKRSLDGYITFRKAVIFTLLGFAVILYVGPSIFSWLFRSNSSRVFDRLPMCVHDKLKRHAVELSMLSGHISHRPMRIKDEKNYLAYVGNGYFGLVVDSFDNSVDTSDDSFTLRLKGKRTLSVPAGYRPYIEVTPEFSELRTETGTVVNYQEGLAHQVSCFQGGEETGTGLQVSVSHQTYAHRAIQNILVQEIRISNPTSQDVTFKLERRGVVDWDSAKSHVKTVNGPDGDRKFIVVSGPVRVLRSSMSVDETTSGEEFYMASIAVEQIEEKVSVTARMSQTLNTLSSVAYSAKPMPLQESWNEQSETENAAIDALKQALSMSIQTLHSRHVAVWKTLWTTGFGISHSYADNAVNGDQINATMYYVLSQAPAPLHAIKVSDDVRSELSAQLAYLEGCYGGLPTLHATNLWRSLSTLDEVNTAVQYWLLSLERNDCHKLIGAGADGVVQAMVLSFAGLKFHHQHLELNSHPKDLHRDYQIRRISYGNSTHVNISVEVQPDNKAVIHVALDRKDKDYFACDAGCLDPPVKLSTDPSTFPVKLTDPVTAVLYITSDQVHMQELKHAIHVKDLSIAPAHEHHVIALHRHGNKLGGLPTIFWFSVGFLILIFHLFLFKLIWQEYCSGQDKFRTSKYI